MARIRSIHPELCRDDTLPNVSAEAERTFIRLWPHLDDEGRAKDNPKLLKADLYPLHDHVTADDVERDLCELAANGLILRYEVAGKRYLTAKPEAWHTYQKPRHPTESKLPSPEEGNVTPPEDYRRSTAERRNPPAGVVVGEGVGDGGGEGVSAPDGAPPPARLSQPRGFVELVDPTGPVAIRRETTAVLDHANTLAPDSPVMASERKQLRPVIEEALASGYKPAELACAIAATPFRTRAGVMGELRKNKQQPQRRSSVGDSGLAAAAEWLQGREGA